jgi:prolyl oligopeptidase
MNLLVHRTGSAVAMAALITLAVTPIAALADAPVASSQATPEPPVTRVDVVTDTIFGHVIEDPYRWLEDFQSDDAQNWIEEQTAYLRDVLDAYPDRDAVRERLLQLFRIPSLGSMWKRGDRIFFMRRDPDNEQAVLYVQQGPDGDPRLLLDPEALSDTTRVGIDWWYPSVEGELLVYGTSEEGDEASVLHVMDVTSGELLPDSIPNTRSASVAWDRDGGGFYYTRFPAPGEVPETELFFHRRVFHHKLGTEPAGDPLIYENEDMHAWPSVSISTDGRFLIIYVFRGYTQNDLYVKDVAAGSDPTPIAEGIDARFSGFAIGDEFYMTTTYGAPNWKLYKVNLEHPGMENWVELLPESEHALVGHVVAGDYLVVHYLVDARSVIKVYTTDGTYLRDVPLPRVTSLYDWTCDYRSPELLLGINSYLTPPTAYRYNIPDDRLTTFETVDAPIDTEPYVEEQVWYESKDGTRVPMFLVHRRDIALDGNNPTLLTGYGGFNVPVTPGFTRNRFLWMEHGGIYAEACLRGGGEYGDAWHRAGILENKQNSFDDFIAAAEWLIDGGYTNPQKLAVWGGSNGGLLIGAFITQRPDLARAAICDVPLLDMVRFHLFYGATMWTPEYGNPGDPEQFEWLYAYSPYQHVEPGVRYPAVLITTAESDTRVHPSHAMKMAARLQAATSGDGPILLKFERAAGHGVGTPMSLTLDQYTDYYSFLFGQLGIRF